MKPLGLLHLYRMRARRRFVQEVFAMVGLAVGVALLFASQVANTSLKGSVGQLTGGLVGQSRLQLAARGPEGFPEDLLASVQRLPGVRAAAPVLQVQANVLGPGGARSVDLIGADPRFVKFGGSLLRHIRAATLARQHAVALPAAVAQQIDANALEVIKVQIGASTVNALLGITLQESAIGQLAQSPVLLAPLAFAQELAGMQRRISRIFVQPAPGREREVRTALLRLARGRINVEPADYDATLFDSAAQPTDQSTSLFAAISALVGFLFAFNAMLLTVPARRALVVDLLHEGYAPVTVIEVLLFDALVLGVLASIAGLALGELLSLHLFHASPGYLSFAFAVGSQRIVTWQSIALAVAGGMLAATVGVLAPLHDIFTNGIAGASPSTANRSRRLAPKLTLTAGIGCLALTTAIVTLAPAAAVVGVIALTAALLLLLPPILRGVLLAAERVSENVRAKAPFLAISELRSTWTRTVGIAAIGAVAVFGSVAIQGAHTNLQRGLDRSARDVTNVAALWVFPPGPSNLLATAPFRTENAAQLARLPGVRELSIYRGGFLDYRTRRVWVSAQPQSQPQMVFAHQLVKGDLAQADRLVRTGRWAVISKAISTEFDLPIGSTFTLPAPQPTRFKVAALSTNVGWPPGAIIISSESYAHAWESTDASAYEITTTPGAPLARVQREMQAALGPSSGLQVQTAAQRESQQRTASRQGLERLSQISALVLVAAILAMVAAIGNMLWQRRPRLARLKIDGFSDAAVWRTLLLESVLLVGSGCLIGAVFGLYGQLLGSRAILAVTGFPVVFSLDVPLALESLALVTGVAVAITAIPGYFAARSQPLVGATG